MNELHKRSVINCFRTADRVSVEYTVAQSDDPEDRYTFVTRRHEITDKEQLAAIARHLSGIHVDRYQSNFLFIPTGGTYSNWMFAYNVSVYTSQDATPRQFRVNSDSLYEVGKEGRVFLHMGERLLRDLRAR